jgi:hypothetical protein
MTMWEHYEGGIIKELYNKGAISINVYVKFRYVQVYKAYEKQGLSKMQAYAHAAHECGVSERTIMRAIEMVCR